MDQQLSFFKAITDVNAPAGFEQPMTQFMKDAFDEMKLNTVKDNTGSIFAMKEAKSQHSIMLLGHLDEVGFIVTDITDKGFIKFTTLGYWWPNVLLSQKVSILTKSGVIRGIIGGKPPHVLSPTDREKAVVLNELFIDIGSDSKEDTLASGVRIGDPITPYSEFEVMHNPNYLLAKAWDNRFGCALAIDVLKNLNNQITVYSGAVTQEETLSRGAKTAAHKVKPSLAIALDVGICSNTPGMEGKSQAKLGDGPIVMLMDVWHIGHPSLRQFVLDIAEKEGINVQHDFLTGGYTDAGHVAQSLDGVPAITICVPTRYIHSNTSIMHKEDYNQALKLVKKVTESLTDEVVEKIINQTY